jgi:hypothetical protein
VRSLVGVSLVLLLGLAGAIGYVQLSDRSSRELRAGVERYARALEKQDLQATLEEIAPSHRGEWTEFVRSQLGNIYEVKGFAVRGPSPLERLSQRQGGDATELTVYMDVNRGWPDFFFQPTTRIPVTVEGGRYYLAAPPLAMEALANGS